MRLIDADAVEKITWQDPSYTDPLNVLTEVREKVRALPTIDAVPVIRCRDCKHALLTYDGDAKYCRFWDDKYDVSTSLYLDGDFYCAWAERKEE